MIEVFGSDISKEETPIAFDLAALHTQDVLRVRVGAGEPMEIGDILDLVFDRQKDIIETIARLERALSKTTGN